VGQGVDSEVWMGKRVGIRYVDHRSSFRSFYPARSRVRVLTQDSVQMALQLMFRV
jgi:hypothetical protein